MSDEMTSSPALPVQAQESLSPGQRLRKARESAGLHIVALAAALKVPVRKLEALEADRWQDLTDATFVRALASSVPRHLRVDAAPILEGLPTVAPKAIAIPDGLGKASDSNRLNATPLRIAPVYLGVLAILVAAVLMYFVPVTWLQWPVARTGSVEEAPAAKAEPTSDLQQPSAVAAQTAVEVHADQSKISAEADATTVAIAPVAIASATPLVADSSASSAQAATMPSGSVAPSDSIKIAIKVSANSWLDISGRDGKVLYQRVAKPGEVVEFDNAAGYSVVVGNVAGTQVLVRGQPFDMTEINRNNVARFEVK